MTGHAILLITVFMPVIAYIVIYCMRKKGLRPMRVPPTSAVAAKLRQCERRIK